jgi:hypothetical protein
MRTSSSKLVATLFASTLAGCPPAQMPDEHGEALPPFHCNADADCHSPACGPCTSGEVLRQQNLTCAVNPCPNVAVVCSPQHMCVVK